jgi:hypothetical protein
MNRNSIKPVLLIVAGTLFAGVVAAAAEPASKPEANPVGKADMHRGMMGGTNGGSMMDMMGMMKSCQSMMGSGSMHSDAAAFKLPPGNEKLETQMHAEMLQKMGEIATKYADRIKEDK